jgi:hypothetical protein
MTEKGGFRVSQDYAILEPKSGPAFPIPCEEWERLKSRLKKVSSPPWLYEACASVLAGISLTMLVNILTDMLPDPKIHPNASVVAWAVFVGSGVLAMAFFGFSVVGRRMRNVYVSDVIGDMELIEKRFVTAEQPTNGTQSGDLIILEARYGARDHRIDVSDALKYASNNGRLHVFVGNQLGGDPCPNVPKDLIVKYMFKGQEFTKAIVEGSDLDLP